MTPSEDIDVRWGSASHAGHLREENEDSMLARPPVFLVADGMGGHERGREASALVVTAFDSAASSEWLTLEDVNTAVTDASSSVGALRDGAYDPPGSTVSGVGLCLHEGRPSWLVFNIGDSRTYRMSGSRLEQVTVDHSELQEEVDRGTDPLQARAMVPGHVITRAIGGGPHVVPAVDQWLLPAHVGDRVLVCSDGLSDELTDDRILELLAEHADPADAARELVAAALDAGGRDNVTAVVVEALSVARPGTPSQASDDTIPDIRVFTEDRTVPDLPALPRPDVRGSLA